MAFSTADELWQDVFPQIGFQHSFVMHAILSLSALHLAHLDTSCRRRRLRDAAQHHNEALKGFRECIDQMKDDASDALFACASLNIVYVFGMFGRVYDDDASDVTAASRKQRTLGGEWIPMIRGVDAVLKPIYLRVRTGPLAPLLNIGNWDDIDPDNNPLPEDEYFRSLQALWSEDSGAEVYDKALYVLRKCCKYVKQPGTTTAEVHAQWGYNGRWAGPMIWLYFSPEEVFLPLHQRQPAALLIFAYFGALLHELEGYWFMKGWGYDIVNVVDELLGDYWSNWTEWPKQAVGLG